MTAVLKASTTTMTYHEFFSCPILFPGRRDGHGGLADRAVAFECVNSGSMLADVVFQRSVHLALSLQTFEIFKTVSETVRFH